MQYTAKDFPRAIVLTGGISTGKSTVAKMFEEDGYTMIDADRIAHEVLEDQSEAIVRLFGEEMLKEGRIDRKALGALVFADVEKRKALESLLHPLIYDRITALARELEKKGDPYIVDIPLFFETRRYPMEKTLLVYAPRELQLKRLQQRDGYNIQEALQRIEAQMPIDKKKILARYVVDNSGSLEALKNNYEKIKKRILGEMQ